MLIVVRRDDHQLAVINTDEIIQVVWVDRANDHDHWSVQMTHGRELDILTVKPSVAIPTTAAGTRMAMVEKFKWQAAAELLSRGDPR